MPIQIIVAFDGMTSAGIITGIPFVKAGDKVVSVQVMSGGTIADVTSVFLPFAPSDGALYQNGSSFNGFVFLATLQRNY